MTAWFAEGLREGMRTMKLYYGAEAGMWSLVWLRVLLGSRTAKSGLLSIDLHEER